MIYPKKTSWFFLKNSFNFSIVFGLENHRNWTVINDMKFIYLTILLRCFRCHSLTFELQILEQLQLRELEHLLCKMIRVNMRCFSRLIQIKCWSRCKELLIILNNLKLLPWEDLLSFQHRLFRQLKDWFDICFVD